MKKYLNVLTAVFMAVLLSMPQALPVKAWEESLSCTVLGDSIAKGYSSDKAVPINSYGQIIAEQLAQEYSLSSDYVNYAKNGLDTFELNNEILIREDVLQSLSEADLILLTVGSNDLLNELKKGAQEILKEDTKFHSANEALAVLEEMVKKNPFLVFKIIDSLSNWDYMEFEAQWVNAIETIVGHKKEGTQIIVTNIYNPVYNMNLPGAMNKVVENIIQNMNDIIYKRAREFDYSVADLFDSSIVAYVQSDGLHPSQEGQKLIAQMVDKKITIPTENIPLELADGNAIKGESLEQGESVFPQQPSQQGEEQENKKPLSSKEDMRTGVFILLVCSAGLVLLLLVTFIKNRRRNKR